MVTFLLQLTKGSRKKYIFTSSSQLPSHISSCLEKSLIFTILHFSGSELKTNIFFFDFDFFSIFNASKNATYKDCQFKIKLLVFNVKCQLRDNVSLNFKCQFPVEKVVFAIGITLSAVLLFIISVILIRPNQVWSSDLNGYLT